MSLFETGIRPYIDEYLKKKSEERRDYGQYWSASSAGYCMRKVIYDRLGVPLVKDDARKTRVFEVGHVFHAWLQDITREAGISVAQELELQDEELMIRGHFDDLILAYSHLILYDYKTAHSRSFSYKKGKPMSYFHEMQLGTYLYMLRQLMAAPVKPTELDNLPELEEARIMTISKDDLRMDETQLLWSPDIEKRVLDYWTTLNKLWAEKKLPACTCADHEGGFMARPAYNPYFYQDEPCSLDWLKKCKEEGLVTW